MHRNKNTYRIVASVLLLLFSMLIVTPTIISLVKKNKDISMFYDLTEEENGKTPKISHQDIIPFITLTYEITFAFTEQKNTHTFYKEKLSLFSYKETVNPPPEYRS
ncbi:hypothetical protein ACG2LH_02155 [Zhouia sp. PK063]|uniref:hypothetical protein n=1 Tax=Zhouia sp. PK063 TaxID=3373602 RepID=UPI00378D3640